MQLMRYLCENGVEPEQWLEVLADAGEVCQPLQNPAAEPEFAGFAGENLDFCAICPV